MNTFSVFFFIQRRVMGYKKGTDHESFQYFFMLVTCLFENEIEEKDYRVCYHRNQSYQILRFGKPGTRSSMFPVIVVIDSVTINHRWDHVYKRGFTGHACQ
jgi:hypothetical protein